MALYARGGRRGRREVAIRVIKIEMHNFPEATAIIVVLRRTQ